jgi:hypothetical protein
MARKYNIGAGSGLSTLKSTTEFDSKDLHRSPRLPIILHDIVDKSIEFQSILQNQNIISVQQLGPLSHTTH